LQFIKKNKAEALEVKSFHWDGDLISFLIYEALAKVIIKKKIADFNSF